jgi:large subunit ribosomal protein L22
MKKADYQAFCITKYIRISPYKLRKIADLVRGKSVKYALSLLKIMNQRGATVVYKSLKSAYHNAINDKSLKAESLVLNGIIVDEAGGLKRMCPRARGRSFAIKKRSSHLKIGLNVITGVKNGSKS